MVVRRCVRDAANRAPTGLRCKHPKVPTSIGAAACSKRPAVRQFMRMLSFHQTTECTKSERVPQLRVPREWQRTLS